MSLHVVQADERFHSILGVEGRYMGATVGGKGYRDGTFTRQRWLCSAPIAGYGGEATLTAEFRFDDDCRNGHNTFSVTAQVYVTHRREVVACGCMHNEIARAWPALAPLLKWHGTSTDGPLHYVANTVYQAGDRDHWGSGRARRGRTRTPRGS